MYPFMDVWWFWDNASWLRKYCSALAVNNLLFWQYFLPLFAMSDLQQMSTYEIIASQVKELGRWVWKKRQYKEIINFVVENALYGPCSLHVPSSQHN